MGLLLICASFIFGYAFEQLKSGCESASCSPFERIFFNQRQENNWGPSFEFVSIKSSIGAASQPAYFYTSKSHQPKPLVISLHSWSGDYAQSDPLADHFEELGWNYIHPDFRGPNNTVDSCLSNLVIQDIDDAIEYMFSTGGVDRKNVFIVGVSGGAYTALGHYLKSGLEINAYLAWVPISDLNKWHTQSEHRSLPYSNDILKCSSVTGEFDMDKIAERSPFNMDSAKDNIENTRLEMYAGLYDGYHGSVPISQSVRFYNKLATNRGYDEARIPDSKIVDLLSLSVSKDKSLEQIGEREVYLYATFPGVSVTIFDGDHEMIVSHVVDRLQHLIVN